MYYKNYKAGMNIKHNVIVFLILLLVVSLPSSAVSEEKPLWELGIGAAFLQMPDYRGSDEYKFYVLPYPYIVYRGDILKVDDRRITGRVFKTDRVLLDFSIFGSVPVDSSDNTARAGMPDLDPTFEFGPALRITIMESKTDNYKLSLTLPVRSVFSTDFSSVHHEGWIFSPRINFEKGDFIPETGIELGISAGPVFADSSYHDYYYTVERAYATPIRPAYSARGGYSGSTLTVGLKKEYKQFIFNAFASADFLHGAVFEDSPLVKNKTSVMSGFSVAWMFFKSAKTVASDK
ncbi:MAG: MipA/OmpV family protein [Syntrophaceae bacterium]|nr:MipA/OmpV family protein [Syntrophaceae bacterium]